VYFMGPLRNALHCMHASKLRTILTMLGIILSEAVMILTSGLGIGLESGYNAASLNNNGTWTIAPLPAPLQAGGNHPRSLTDSDIAALTKGADPKIISDVVPVVSGMAPVRYNGNQYGGVIYGSSAAFLRVQSTAIRLTGGSVFTEQQYKDSARVILIGPDLLRALFNGDADAAMGSTVQIGLVSFKVIGTIGPGPWSLALVPLTTARAFLFGGKHTVQSIDIRQADLYATMPAVNQITDILDREHFIKNPGQRDYAISPVNLSQWPLTEQTLTLLRWVTVAATGIALLIGALGLANIMLVTVTERTSEIGIRRAVGARRSAILRHFLFESVLVAGLGGIIGIGLGVAATVGAQRLLSNTGPLYGVPGFSVTSILSAFGLSLLVGLAAGCYPATRAARMQPWDALRY
jgi:putative ABC transport system permease protein